jgi:hypothetical protein
MKISTILVVASIVTIFTCNFVPSLPKKIAEDERQRIINLSLEEAAAIYKIEELRGFDVRYLSSGTFIVRICRWDYISDKEFEDSLAEMGKVIGKLKFVDAYVHTDTFQQRHFELLKECHGIYFNCNTETNEFFEQFCAENSIVPLDRTYWGQSLLHDSLTMEYAPR